MNDLIQPVQIVTVGKNHVFEFNIENLKNVLKDVGDKKIVVISVVGSGLSEKSFLLNFFIRYLKAYTKSQTTMGLGSKNEPFKGWKSDSDSVRPGILLWGEAFVISLPSEEQVAVLLMETHGLSNLYSLKQAAAKLFTLSTLLSSIQIYNVSQNIDSDDLQNLQMFIDYGDICRSDKEFVPFQELLFLVRDWQVSHELSYGFEGGNKLLRNRLKKELCRHDDIIRSICEHLPVCFTNIEGFLMPHPGKQVARNEDYTSCLLDMHDDFRYYMKKIVSSLIAPERIPIKEIGGMKISAEDFIRYFEIYTTLFQKEECAKPIEIYEVIAEEIHRTAVEKAIATYQTNMDLICGDGKPYMPWRDFQPKHAENREIALNVYHAAFKIGKERYSKTMENQLKQAIYSLFINYNTKNRCKKPKPCMMLSILG